MKIFAYGTLMFSEVVETLAGPVPSSMFAKVKGFRRFEATLRSKANFPYVEKADSESTVEGVIYDHVTPRQLEIFDWFEGEGSWYYRIDVNSNEFVVELPGTLGESENVGMYIIGPQLKTHIFDFFAAQGRQVQKRDWSPEEFRQNHLRWYFWNTVLPTIEDPEFINRFGDHTKSSHVDTLKQKYTQP